MKIIDTYDSILSAYQDGQFNLELWEKYADNIPIDLKQKVKSDYLRNDFENLGLPVLNSLPGKAELLEQAHSSFLKVTDHLSQKIIDKFGVDLDVTIVLYLGLCNAAGWATKIDGKNVVLLGIEKIVELEWCKKNESTIKSEYLHRVDNNESVQDFFDDWCSYENHSDVGYFLGSRFVLYLMKEYSLQEIADFKLKKAYKRFCKYVNI